MNIVAFAASSNSHSINKKLITYAASLIPQHTVEIIDLKDFELPLFSEDRERELGQPDLARAFFDKLGNADAILISFAEHNGTYSAAYKNLFDWCSRINPKVFQGKDMIVLSTSPGPGGGQSVLANALNSIPFFNGNVLASLSIPNFYDNFDVDALRLTHQDYQKQLVEALKQLD